MNTTIFNENGDVICDPENDLICVKPCLTLLLENMIGYEKIYGPREEEVQHLIDSVSSNVIPDFDEMLMANLSLIGMDMPGHLQFDFFHDVQPVADNDEDSQSVSGNNEQVLDTAQGVFEDDVQSIISDKPAAPPAVVATVCADTARDPVVVQGKENASAKRDVAVVEDSEDDDGDDSDSSDDEADKKGPVRQSVYTGRKRVLVNIQPPVVNKKIKLTVPTKCDRLLIVTRNVICLMEFLVKQEGVVITGFSKGVNRKPALSPKDTAEEQTSKKLEAKLASFPMIVRGFDRETNEFNFDIPQLRGKDADFDIEKALTARYMTDKNKDESITLKHIPRTVRYNFETTSNFPMYVRSTSDLPMRFNPQPGYSSVVAIRTNDSGNRGAIRDGELLFDTCQLPDIEKFLKRRLVIEKLAEWKTPLRMNLCLMGENGTDVLIDYNVNTGIIGLDRSTNTFSLWIEVNRDFKIKNNNIETEHSCVVTSAPGVIRLTSLTAFEDCVVDRTGHFRLSFNVSIVIKSNDTVANVRLTVAIPKLADIEYDAIFNKLVYNNFTFKKLFESQIKLPKLFS